MKQIILFALFAFSLVTMTNSQPQKKKLAQLPVTINVSIEEGLPDTLTLLYWDLNFENSASPLTVPNHRFVSTGRTARFQFPVPIDQRCVYFCLYNGEKSVQKNKKLNLYLAEPGDEVTISFKQEGVRFAGKGSLKYQCRYLIDSAVLQWVKTPKETDYTRGKKRPPDSLRYYFYPDDLRYGLLYETEKLTVARRVLDSCKNNLTTFCYEVMKADIIGRSESDVLFGFVIYSTNFPIGFPLKSKDSIQKKLLEVYTLRKPLLEEKIPEQVILMSANYKTYLVNRAARAGMLFNTDGYLWLKKNYNGALRDRLLAAYFMHSASFKNTWKQREEALTIVQDTNCKNILKPLFDHKRKGAPAFTFSLPDSSGHIVSSDDFKGKTVVLDFWFTGCSGCFALARVMPAVADKFRDNKKVVFVSICVDTNTTTWKKSISSGLYTGKEYVNLYTNGEGMEHPIIRHYSVQAFPKLMIIDPAGKIFSGDIRISGSADINKCISLINQTILPDKIK